MVTHLPQSPGKAMLFHKPSIKWLTGAMGRTDSRMVKVDLRPRAGMTEVCMPYGSVVLPSDSDADWVPTTSCLREGMKDVLQHQ